MKGLMGVAGALAFVLIAGVPLAAQAQSDEGKAIGSADRGRVIFQNGKGDNVPACSSCHGVDGLGSDDMGTPRLAYQVDTYILKQLEDFAHDRRTDNTMSAMNDIAKGLTAQDRKDMAAYVSTLKTPFMGSDLDALRANDVKVGEPYKGEIIAHFGLPDHGVPACKSCHGYNGRSAGRLFPAIGGQRYVYLKHELEAWRKGATGSRADAARYNDYMGLMRGVASHLTDEDIDNVAAFLTSAKPVSPGNPRAPVRN
ncbi:MAG: c-type cytochrome [Mariprofundales bacterium]|nr:c-type cytochrome [Mariprofundales bacterium]